MFVCACMCTYVYIHSTCADGGLHFSHQYISKCVSYTLNVHAVHFCRLISAEPNEDSKLTHARTAWINYRSLATAEWWRRSIKYLIKLGTWHKSATTVVHSFFVAENIVRLWLSTHLQLWEAAVGQKHTRVRFCGRKFPKTNLHFSQNLLSVFSLCVTWKILRKRFPLFSLLTFNERKNLEGIVRHTHTHTHTHTFLRAVLLLRTSDFMSLYMNIRVCICMNIVTYFCVCNVCVCCCDQDRSEHNWYCMGWLHVVGSLKLQVSFAKEPYERADILQKRPVILRSLLIIATP